MTHPDVEIFNATLNKFLEGRMFQRAVTVIVPDRYASIDEFLKDSGLEMPTLSWDHTMNRGYEPVETLARGIYEHMEHNGPGKKPAWVPNGNSLKQDEARMAARRSLWAAGHTRC